MQAPLIVILGVVCPRLHGFTVWYSADPTARASDLEFGSICKASCNSYRQSRKFYIERVVNFTNGEFLAGGQRSAPRCVMLHPRRGRAGRGWRARLVCAHYSGLFVIIKVMRRCDAARQVNQWLGAGPMGSGYRLWAIRAEAVQHFPLRLILRVWRCGR